MGTTATCFDRTVRLLQGFRISLPADTMAALVFLLVRLVLALYLTAFVSIAGVISIERWSEGAHVTPAMWAEHMEMVSLGYIDHHYHDDAIHATSSATVTTSQQVLPFMPVWNALPEFPLVVDWTPMVASVAALIAIVFVAGRLCANRARDPFTDYRPPIPQRPPILPTYS